jgi:DNA topoisomerase IA
LYESLKHHSNKNAYSELINQSLEAGLVSTIAIKHEKTKQGMGRVKSGVLDLLLQKVKQELDKETQQDNVDVVIKVNGKSIQGRLIDNSQTLSGRVNKEKKSITVHSDKWQIVNQQVTEQVVSPPGTSTTEVLQHAWRQHQMKPDDVMAALQYLYEGDF